MDKDNRQEEVLKFWFKTLSFKDWFMGGSRVDSLLREQFLDLMDKVAAGVCDSWAETIEGRLALILVCDQFSRNIFRGYARSFALDSKARSLVLEVLAKEKKGADSIDLDESHKMFFFMPLMHSENMEDQNLAVEIFTALGNEASTKEALQHQAIIKRFGRFPHRNEALARKNTTEEDSYLSDSNTSNYGVQKKSS